jgi:hypothetical protein
VDVEVTLQMTELAHAVASDRNHLPQIRELGMRGNAAAAEFVGLASVLKR